MRAPQPRRVTSATLAVVFAIALVGDAMATHPCPHHHGATAHSAEHADGHGTDHASGEASHGPCTCVGRCHAGTAPPLPPPILLEAIPVPEPAPATTPQPAADRRARNPFSLPWANAPPTL